MIKHLIITSSLISVYFAATCTSFAGPILKEPVSTYKQGFWVKKMQKRKGANKLKLSNKGTNNRGIVRQTDYTDNTPRFISKWWSPILPDRSHNLSDVYLDSSTNNNYITIDQVKLDKENNRAKVKITNNSNNNEGSISQRGSGNRATINIDGNSSNNRQHGSGNWCIIPEPSVQIVQGSRGNRAYFNSARIDLRNNSSYNSAYIFQDGQSNRAFAKLDNSRGNHVTINQRKSMNRARAYLKNSHNNIMTVSQLSSKNTANAYLKNSTFNNLYLQQNGLGSHRTNVRLNGASLNKIYTKQSGNNNNLHLTVGNSYKNTITLGQNGSRQNAYVNIQNSAYSKFTLDPAKASRNNVRFSGHNMFRKTVNIR